MSQIREWACPALAAGALFVGSSSLPADIVAIPAAKDNTLYQDAAGSLSNGAGQYFFAGHSSIITNNVRRGLIAFDVAGNIPAGSVINSVRLRLFMSRTISGAESVALHRVLADWGEGASTAFGEEGGGGPSAPGDATWIHRFYDTDFWSAAGGDFDLTASAGILVGGIAFYTWGSNPAMVADVQDWLDNPATNFGWLLKGNESPQPTAKRFDTRENLAPANRPVLLVCYTPPTCPTCSGDLNGDARADGGDIQAFVGCFLGGNPGAPGCGCADMDQNAVFDGNDVNLFVDKLLNDPLCCV